MDITLGFGPRVLGSSPDGSTATGARQLLGVRQDEKAGAMRDSAGEAGSGRLFFAERSEREKLSDRDRVLTGARTGYWMLDFGFWTSA